MKLDITWIISVAAIGILSACGSAKGPGNSGASGGSQAGGSAGAGGVTDEVGGTLSESGGATTSNACSDSSGVCDAGVDAGSTVPIVITSAAGTYWQSGQLTEVTSPNADVTVNDSSEAQTWDGFGGCFTELGWDYLSKLSQPDQDQAMQLLFGSEGARFAWGRIPIGGNDYVVTRHTLDDTGDDVIPDSTESNRPPADPSLSKFSIAGDLQNLVPYIKAAQAVKSNIRFWAVPWTPPVWMKTGYTSDLYGTPAKRPSYYDGGSMKSDDATLNAHAQYFVKFVQAYRDQGINVELVAPQNEPSGGHTYPSCTWDKTTYTSFIGQYLGPALSAAGLNTKVMLGGSFDAAQDIDFVNAVLADPTAKGYCAVGGVGYDMVAPANVAAMKAAGLPVWVSEHSAGNYYWNPPGYPAYQPVAPNDLAYAVETWGLIRDAITKSGVKAYNAWHMVLDKVGKDIDETNDWAQDSLLVADSGQLTITPAYYVFRHFSRFVEPGAKVVGTTGGDAVAFKNPGGSLVVVLYNAGAAQTLTVAIGGKKLQFSAPSSGFATLVAP